MHSETSNFWKLLVILQKILNDYRRRHSKPKIDLSFLFVWFTLFVNNFKSRKFCPVKLFANYRSIHHPVYLLFVKWLQYTTKQISCKYIANNSKASLSRINISHYGYHHVVYQQSICNFLNSLLMVLRLLFCDIYIRTWVYLWVYVCVRAYEFQGWTKFMAKMHI